MRAGLLPQAAPHRLEQALGHAAQRLRVVLLQEVARRVVMQVGVGDQRVLVVADHAGRGVEAEQVVDGGGHLGRALVAVTAHARDPLRVHGARADHARHLFAQGADARRPGVAEIAVVQRGGRAGQRLHGGGHAALELRVVVGVEQVVLAVVLVVQHRVELVPSRCSKARRAGTPWPSCP